MRVHMAQKRMTFAQADTLLYYLHSFKYVTSVQVRERTGDAIICYVGDREAIIDRLRKFHYEDVEMPEGLIENSGRKVNQESQDKLVYKVLREKIPSAISAPGMLYRTYIHKIYQRRITDTCGAKDRGTGLRRDSDQYLHAARRF